MIRYMGGLGQSSDPAGPSYDTEGLPLVPGLVEVVTRETTAPGERHAALAGHEGEIAIKAWGGNPVDPKTQIGGVRWILAVDWVPYQLPTFVTPAFQGYVSGHSTFSRAAAEVLTAFTGSEYFPGGVSGYTIKAGSLKFEQGPTTRHPARMGDLLRRGRPGGPVAPVRRDPRRGRRLHRSQDRFRVWHRGVGARPALLRRRDGQLSQTRCRPATRRIRELVSPRTRTIAAAVGVLAHGRHRRQRSARPAPRQRAAHGPGSAPLRRRDRVIGDRSHL